MATSGSIIAASASISPGALMPASTTAMRCRTGSRRVNVRGTPRWLLRLPSVAATPLAAPPRRSASKSLVEVLPALPEIPTTGPGNARRCMRAIACHAASGSATSSCGSANAGSGIRTSAAPAPAAAAAPMKACPSRAGVRSATNTSPRASSRESKWKPFRGSRGCPCQRPPVHRASCSAVKTGIRRSPPPPRRGPPAAPAGGAGHRPAPGSHRDSHTFHASVPLRRPHPRAGPPSPPPPARRAGPDQ